MAARPVPLGHKTGAARTLSRVRAVQASALASAGPVAGGNATARPGSDPYKRQRNARAKYLKSHGQKVRQAKASSAHLRPAAALSRRPFHQSGFNSGEPMLFGSRG